MPAAYTQLSQAELKERVERAQAALSHCTLCPRACGADRLAGECGECLIAGKARVASCGPHLGEERPVRGKRGSGTIFFAGCSLRCVYCQNYDISQRCVGSEVDTRELGQLMLGLQRRGCHNINLVSPSHVIPQALAGLAWAAQHGLDLPIVYNTGGYDSQAALKLLAGIVDIYMPDVKYQDEAVAERLSDVRSYPEVNQAALKEMHHQVGALELDDEGLAVRGVLVRHLVLPGGLAGTAEAMQFLAGELSRDTYVNIMDQYYPAYQAHKHPPLDRRITSGEFLEALSAARKAGLHRIYGLTESG